jgi:hypothetical protein
MASTISTYQVTALPDTAWQPVPLERPGKHRDDARADNPCSPAQRFVALGVAKTHIGGAAAAPLARRPSELPQVTL